tara:strand:- start:1627 stop:1728 length:102 start_codon:yes stop_codon:yes gene_type:complete
MNEMPIRNLTFEELLSLLSFCFKAGNANKKSGV